MNDKLKFKFSPRETLMALVINESVTVPTKLCKCMTMRNAAKLIDDRSFSISERGLINEYEVTRIG